MRLLNVDTVTFTSFPSSQLPCYAIASHRWVEGTEASFEDVQERKETGKAGYCKLLGFVDYIKIHMPLVKWLWIDTCCIKQQSDRELSMSINSMFHWYRKAEVCLAYLEDVSAADDIAVFKNSIWFRRGWTLQELLAPGLVVFLTRDWDIVGHKGHGGRGRSGVSMRAGPSLEKLISEITNIPKSVLQDYDNSKSLSTEQKLEWMRGRETTYGEDLSYCLLGILDVSMNIRYGDGEEKTRARLQKKVSQKLIRTTSEKYGIRFSLPQCTYICICISIFICLYISRNQSVKHHIPFRFHGMPTTDHFVPRPGDMQHITSFFRSGSAAEQRRIFVVHGVGGMGKTQLCAEYARTHREEFSAVFWLDGSSKDALHEFMANAALRLPTHQSKHVDTTAQASQDELYQSFLQWLSLEDNTNWLLIIDNVDRDWQAGAEDPQAYDYRDCLPHVDHGNVLITTRIRRLQRPKASLNLGRVEDALAREMVEVRAGKQIEDLEPLLSRLGGMPLALAQAGAYLRKTGMSVPAYVRIYEETWTDLMRSQDRFPLHEYADRSVLTTWKVSYEQVKAVEPRASGLLDLWAFLHTDVWPELALKIREQMYSINFNPSANDIILPMDELSFWDSLGVLVEYSLVDGTLGGALYSIHPVVHSWCMHNIGTAEKAQRLLNLALHLVEEMVRVISTNVTSGAARQLANHARAVSARAHMLDESEQAATGAHEIAVFLEGRGVPNEVENLYLQALRSIEKSHSKGHTATLTFVIRLSLFYLQQGKMIEGEAMYLRAEQEWADASAKHPALALPYIEFAVLHSAYGRYEHAELIFDGVLRAYAGAGYHEHVMTLDCIYRLGELYRIQGRTREAEEMFTLALQTHTRVLGAGHTSTLNTVNTLGSLYAD